MYGGDELLALVGIRPTFAGGAFLPFRTKVISLRGALIQLSHQTSEICGADRPYDVTLRMPRLKHATARLQLAHHHRMHHAIALHQQTVRTGFYLPSRRMQIRRENGQGTDELSERRQSPARSGEYVDEPGIALAP